MRTLRYILLIAFTLLFLLPSVNAGTHGLAVVAKDKAAGRPIDTIEAAVSEIGRLNDSIDEIGSAFRHELAESGHLIEDRYDTEIAEARAFQDSQPLNRYEGETESEFRDRVAKQLSDYEERIGELQKKKQSELDELDRRIAKEQAAQTEELRNTLKQLAEREYTLGAESLSLKIGTYDMECGAFPVSLMNKSIRKLEADSEGKEIEVTETLHPADIMVAVKGTVPMPEDEARKFEQEWHSGLVRPVVKVRAGSREIVSIALANDADGELIAYENHEFVTMAEKKRRCEEKDIKKRLEETKRILHEKTETKLHEESEKKLHEELKRLAGEFVFVKGGCYQMGCGSGTSDCNYYEKPAHEVCLDDFYIGKYEVTQGQWQEIMGNNPSKFSNCGDNCPVERVSWNDVREFIGKLNSHSEGNKYRLPTEAEWEYAARSGGKNEKFSGSDNIDSVAWYDGNSGNKTHPVGTKSPNGLGIYDMSGNLWEWVNDWYGAYSSSPQNNPSGPASGMFRVRRGGSWYQVAGFSRTSARDWLLPERSSCNVGFRLARTR